MSMPIGYGVDGLAGTRDLAAGFRRGILSQQLVSCLDIVSYNR